MRWIVGHATFAAHPDSLVGPDPIYKYGIVLQISAKDRRAIVVHSCGVGADSRLIILNGEEDKVEILSSGS